MFYIPAFKVLEIQNILHTCNENISFVFLYVIKAFREENDDKVRKSINLCICKCHADNNYAHLKIIL